MDDLYDVLGVSKDSSTEQIKKAYRKRALQTHPDRLPPGATADEKENAGEQFRKVNNAYEVLSDENRRRQYDRHGVWPLPPEFNDEAPHARGHRYDPYSFSFEDARPRRRPRDPFDHPLFQRGDPFANDPFFQHDPFQAFFGPPRPNVHSHAHARGQAPPHPMFSDPFELFDRLFSSDPFFAGAFGPPRHPSHPAAAATATRSPNEVMFPFGAGSMFGPMPFGGLLMPEPFGDRGGFGPGGGCSFQSSSSRTMMGGMGGGASESYVQRTINGVTETIHTRRDAEGNEHVTRTHPDGHQTYSVNGVEQGPPPPAQPVIPPAPRPDVPGLPPPPSYATWGSSASSYEQPEREPERRRKRWPWRS